MGLKVVVLTWDGGLGCHHSARSIPLGLATPQCITHGLYTFPDPVCQEMFSYENVCPTCAGSPPPPKKPAYIPGKPKPGKPNKPGFPSYPPGKPTGYPTGKPPVRPPTYPGMPTYPPRHIAQPGYPGTYPPAGYPAGMPTRPPGQYPPPGYRP